MDQTRTKRRIWISVAAVLGAAVLVTMFCLMYFVWQVPLFDGSGWDVSREGTTRYLDYYRKPLTGWQTLEGAQYYFAPDTGAMATQWQTLEGTRYYLGEDGKLRTGWLETQQGRYYADETGAVQTGWQTVAQQHYYLGEDGIVQTGWLETETGRYFLGADGAAHTGWQTLEEGTYFFDDTGIMQTGWVETEEGKRFLTDQGLLHPNWLETEKGRFYVYDDAPHIGWLETDEGRYYFREDGVMQTGWVTTTEGRFYLYEDGTFAAGFVQVDGITRYFTPTGEYVILVNRWNPVPEDYELNLVTLEGYQVDASCVDALAEMMDACRSLGFSCDINSAYRSIDDQQAIWDNRYARYLAAYGDPQEAERITGQEVAIPGTSEHHLGLAVDIGGYADTYAWLEENCWQYGFIRRYPDNKIEVTGIVYEPWHYRYVGRELAKDIFDSGLCMEEYMEKLSGAAA